MLLISRLAILVLYTGPLIDQPLEVVRNIFDTNTFATLRMAKAVVPLMAKRRSGVIVNVGGGEPLVLLFTLPNIPYHYLGL